MQMDVRASATAMLLALIINGAVAFSGNASPGLPADAARDNIVVTTLAGGSEGYQDGPGSVAAFNSPVGIAVDPRGNVYVADRDNDRIRKITPAGVVTTLAGGAKGLRDGPGAQAEFSGPTGIGLDSLGNLYVADAGNQRIRKINPVGVVTTFASDQTVTDTRPSIYDPFGVSVDRSGNVYIADRHRCVIFRIRTVGVITALAGGGESLARERPDLPDGFGRAAEFSGPSGLAVDPRGNLYVADLRSLRKVTPAGAVTTVAGWRASVPSRPGEDFNVAGGVAVDAHGTIYVADTADHRIRQITPAGVMTTLAGSDVGDRDGSGADAQFDAPWGVAVDRSGNLYIADTGNNRIRKITITAGRGNAHRQRP